MLALGQIDPAAGWEGLIAGRDWADWRLWVGLLVIFWVANQWLALTPPDEWWDALIAAVSLLIAVLAVPVVLNTVIGLGLIGLFRLARR
jgi:predicted small integral membrane protein